MGFHLSTRNFHSRRRPPFQNLLFKTQAILSPFSTFAAGNLFYRKTFSHIFQECSNKKAQKPGKQAHARMIVSGFKPTVFDATCLLQMYIKCSSIECAAKVFDRMSEKNCVSWTAMIFGYSINGKMGLAQSLFDLMPERNVISWTSLMSGYLRNGNCLKSVRLFVIMGRDVVAYNETMFSVVFKACANLKDRVIGKQLHGVVMKFGFERDVAIGTSMLDMYAKCDNLIDARKIFNLLPNPNLQSYTAMIFGYARGDRGFEGTQLFLLLLKSDLGFDEISLYAAFNACAISKGLVVGTQIHGLAIKTPFHDDIIVATAILGMYGKCGALQEARRIFDKMEKRDAVTWTTVIAACEENKNEETLSLFVGMLRSGIKPNDVTYVTVLKACADGQALQNGMEIHGSVIKCGMGTDSFVSEVIVDMYCKCRMVEEAAKLHERMEEQTLVSWRAMINGYSSTEQSERAQKYFSRMLEMGIKPDRLIYSKILNSCSKVANVGLGKQIHAQIIKQELQSNVYIINTLVDMYSKCGNIQESVLMFQKSSNRNVVPWNTMLFAYAHHGCGNEALQMFEKMVVEKVMPDHVTFTGVLHACAHNGLVDEALHYLYVMKSEYGLEPKLQHYSCVVDALGRSGRIIDALKLIQDMPLKAHDAIWTGLLSNCKRQGNVEVAEIAARSLLQLNPQKYSAYFILSDIYADAGMWREAKEMRRIMRTKRLKKRPGCSWIEVQGEVHMFIAGPRFDEISEKLVMLMAEMKSDVNAVMHHYNLDS